MMIPGSGGGVRGAWAFTRQLRLLPTDESEKGRARAARREDSHGYPARAFSYNLIDVCAAKYNQCKIDKHVWNTQKSHFLERKELLLLFFSVGSI